MSNTSGLSHPPSFKEIHPLNIGDYPRLRFLFLKQKIKQKQMEGEAFTTLSCYLTFSSVFITCLCYWQWGLPGETSSITIGNGIAGDTWMSFSSFFCLIMMCLLQRKTLLAVVAGYRVIQTFKMREITPEKEELKITDLAQQCILLEHKAE